MKTTSLKQRTAIIAGATFATALVVSAIYAASPSTQPAPADLLPPQATSPQPSPRANLVQVPYRPVMPPAVVSHDPRILPDDASHPLRATPAIDVPPLADSNPPRPTDPLLPAGPAIRIPSPDVSELPVGVIAEKADAARATLRTDPTSGLVSPGALVHTPPPRTAPPPAQLLSIPDPSHDPGFVPTPTAATESTPVTNIDRPGPTTLPVAGK